MRAFFRILIGYVALAAGASVQAATDFSMSPIAVTDFGSGFYGFSQGGWSGGGMVTGTFTAFDDDNNGQLSSYLNEITNFSMIFSGSANAPAYALGFEDFYGLVYTLDGGLLGDTTEVNPEFSPEGIWAFGAPGVYIAGPAMLSMCNGDLNCGIINAVEGGFGPGSTTVAVPEPSSWALMIAGFGLTGAMMRRRAGYRVA